MTRKDKDKNKAEAIGYIAELHICTTPNLVNKLHTHITLTIEAACDSVTEDNVTQKAFEDFKDWLENPLARNRELILEDFIESIADLRCHHVIYDSLDESEGEATHQAPERIQ